MRAGMPGGVSAVNGSAYVWQGRCVVVCRSAARTELVNGVESPGSGRRNEERCIGTIAGEGAQNRKPTNSQTISSGSSHNNAVKQRDGNGEYQ